MTINEIKRENGNIYLEMVLCHRDFDRFFVYCEDCGEIILKEKALEIDGEYYCSCCVLTCDTCGCLVPRRYSHTVEDSSDYIYCDHCHNQQTYYCDDSGRRFRYSDSVTNVDGNYYCDRCIGAHSPIIQDYHTMKQYGEIKFYGEESRDESVYIGVELELDSDSSFDREEIAEELKCRFGDFFAYENDGSLKHGFEAISMPASINYHINMMPKYIDAFRYLSNNRIESHDVGTCGMHHHLDRRYFSGKEDSSVGKLLYLFEKFRRELMVFSRRTESQADDWARSRKYMSSGKGWIKKTIKDSKSYQDHSMRYFAVNLTNSETIEIRLWRGSINPETFEATLKFSARLAELCKNTSAVKLSKMTFKDLLGSDEVILSYWDRVKERSINRLEEF